jgi:Flp pilus assembly protein TadD
VIYEGLHQDADAIRNYEKAIRLNAKNPDPCNNLAYLYAERGMNLTEALSLVDRALGLDPQNANVKDTKGWVLFKMGRRDAAIPLLKEAAAADPANKLLREHLAAAEKSSVKK